MSDPRGKRKWAGEPHKDQRSSRAPDLERLPPHKKPKVWTLTVEWTVTTTYRRYRKFTSRASRDEARVRIEKHFREEAEKQKRAPVRKYRAWWNRNSPFVEFTDEEVHGIKAAPEYIETYEDES